MPTIEIYTADGNLEADIHVDSFVATGDKVVANLAPGGEYSWPFYQEDE